MSSPNLNSLATAILGELDSDMTQPLFASYHSKLVRSCLFHDDYDEASDSNVLSTIGSGVLDKMVFITTDTHEYFAVRAVALLESWVGVFSMNLESQMNQMVDLLSMKRSLFLEGDLLS